MALDWLQGLLGGGQWGDPSIPAMPTQPLPDDTLAQLRAKLGQGAASSLYAGGGDVQPGLNMLGHAVVAPALAGGAALEATMTGQPVSAAEMLQAAMMGITPTPTRLPGGVPSATPTTMERLWGDESGALKLGGGGPAWGSRLNKAISAGDISAPASVTEAKYIMPSGKLVGTGDEMHEYIAHLLGYGAQGEDSVAKMLRATGAARINSANAIFDKAAPSIDLYHPPTPQQMSRLDSYLKQRGGAEAAFRDQFGRVERGSDLARLVGKGLLD